MYFVFRKLILLFPFYLAVVLLTDYSFIGYWSDIGITVVFTYLSLKYLFRNKPGVSPIWRFLSKMVHASCVVMVIFLFSSQLLNPFLIDTLKLRSFHFVEIEGRFYHAYFKPVGAYSGGYGNLSITESPTWLPIIEHQIHWNRSVHHDFYNDTFDGVPIDNRDVIRNYIRDEILSLRE